MSTAAEPKPTVTGYPAAPSGGYAAAYPYPAPQPPMPYHPTNHYYASNYSRNTNILRCIVLAAIVVFLIVGLATIVLWLVLRPRLPVFTVSSFHLSSFDLSPANHLSANFDLNLTSVNPNSKMSVYYDRVDATVILGPQTVASTSLAPFYQPSGNTTFLRAHMAAMELYIREGVAKVIGDERARGDTVGFDVRVKALVRFSAGAWRTKWHFMSAYCEGVAVKFGNATADFGNLVGPPRYCQVNL